MLDFLSKLPFPIDQLKLGVLFFLAFPLSILFSKIQNVQIRYIYGFVFGIAFQWIIYDWNTLHTLVPATIVYILAKVFKKSCVTPILTFAFLYLSVYHVYRMFSNPGVWRINISFALMIDVCKFTSFAWCYRDGFMPTESLSEDQNYRKIPKLPSVLEYYSYIYFFPSALTGPFFDFRDFENLVTRTGIYKEIDFRRGYLWGLQSLGFGLLSAAGDALFAKKFHPSFVLTDEFMQNGFLYRVLWIIMSGYAMRFKYYVGFYMSQASIDATGLSWTGYVDGKPVFDSVLACDRYVELSDTARKALERWNASTQVWLRRYIYNRILDADKAKGKPQNLFHATWITFFVSAAWHGYYPSYFITFWGVWTCIAASRAVYKARAKFAWIPEPLATAFRFILTVIPINLLTIGHVLLEYKKTLACYNTIYWLPHLYNFLAIFLLPLLGWTKTPKGEKAGEETKKVAPKKKARTTEDHYAELDDDDDDVPTKSKTE